MINRKSGGKARGGVPSPGPVQGWYAALLACRRLDASGIVVTARGIAAELGISPGFGSAWCSKFVAWGYLTFVGKVKGGRGRAAKSYALTKYGLEREKPKFSRTGDDACPTCGQPLKEKP